MRLDIHTAVITASILAIVGLLVSLWVGVRAIRTARTLRFFRMRRVRMVRGWRLILFAFCLGIISIFIQQFAEPAIYRFYPPTATQSNTPTITLTPTLTLTPTITLTPTVTSTPSESETPTVTATPQVPLVIEVLFESKVTPNPAAIFSNLTFTQGINPNTYEPLKPGILFQNPVGHIYALFSYDKMVDKSQWTAIWYRDGDLIYYETKPWDGGTGGIGYTDWDPPASDWLPGVYIVQIYNGLFWKVAGTFTVEGIAPTAPASATPTPSATPSPTITPPVTPPTPTPTRTSVPTNTPTPSRTPWPTVTPITPLPTRTPWPTVTPVTPTLTRTLQKTPTPTATLTKWPTATPVTLTPTLTRQPFATNTPVNPTLTPHPTLTPQPY